jgi:WD40 repeat protein
MHCTLTLMLSCRALTLFTLAMEQPEELASLKGHNATVFSIAFSLDGKTLASASKDATIKLWEVLTGKERATLRGHGGCVWSVALSPDDRLLASCSDDNTVMLWD